MPSAEIVANKVALFDRIRQLRQAEKPDTRLIAQLEEENKELNDQYNFFDQEFEENGKKGIKDIAGNIRVPALYADFSELYHYDVFRHRPIPAVDAHNKSALVATDGTGTPLTPFIYDNIHQIDWTSFYLATIGKKSAVLTAQGKELVPCIIDSYSESFNGISTFSSDGKEGIFTCDGLYVPPIFDKISENSDWVYVSLNGKWGYVDTEGHFVDDTDEEAYDEADLLAWQYL